MSTLIATGLLEKPNGKPLRFGDIWAWAFGNPADDADVLHQQAKKITVAEPVVAPAPEPPVVEPPKPPPPVPPEAQRQFEATVSRFAASFGAAQAPAAKRRARADRTTALCQQFKTVSAPLSATDWVGTVRTMGVDAAGNSYLLINVGSAKIGTASSVAVDGTDRTMIGRGSNLSSIAADLKQGQTVVFSGVFLADKLDCLKLANPILPDAVAAPQFLLQFASLKGVDS